MTDIGAPSAVTAPLPATRPQRQQPVSRAARELEAALASEMIRAARPEPKGPAAFTGGAGARAFDSFMNEALGAALASQGGGLGLARQIETAMGNRSAQPRPNSTPRSTSIVIPPLEPRK